MQRRDFLLSAAAGLAAAAGAMRPGPAQAQGRGGPIPPLGNPAPSPRSPKADRISLMTLDFANWIKDIPDVQPGPQRSIALFDIAEMFADVYNVHKVEFQSVHFQAFTPAYYKALKDAMAKSRASITQINCEFGTLSMSAPTVNARSQAVALTRSWIDIAQAVGAQRVMVNQGGLGKENLQTAIEAFKQMADYGKSKNIIVSIETRGGGGGGARAGAPGGGGAAGPAAGPEITRPAPGLPTWQLMADLIKGAGAYSNPDVGNTNAMSQEDLHRCLGKDLLYPTAGSMHCRVSQFWDLTTAIKYVTSLGYTGNFNLESNLGHEGVKPIYDAVIAAL